MPGAGLRDRATRAQSSREFTQELLEGFLSGPVGGRHGFIMDR
jgi:hypothetical protein